VSYATSEDSFLNAGSVFLRSVNGEIQEYGVTSVKPHQNIYLMKLEGLGPGNEAEKLRGAEILIRKESLSRKNDEYFWYELLGLEVNLDTGGELGVISHIIPTRGNDIYVVKKGKKEIYIPAIYGVIKEIDLENGKMIISATEGLLDLNEV
jgi:16S rRNA processing protein RimM